MKLSLVVPIYNEAENIQPLIGAVEKALSTLDYELILIDDGSQDSTVAEITKRLTSRIKVLVFNRNYGQTTAMAAGIDHAKGELIAMIDGDLQNDPSDILGMIKVMEAQDCDMVVGRRTNRQDGFILRKIPSTVANALIRLLTGVHISDYGCTLKLIRSDVAKNLGLYGELHRFIPVLAKLYGASIAEVDVQHHPRTRGKSKYGIGRTSRVFSDLLLMVFFQKYRQKPMHLFGTLGSIMLLAGLSIDLYLFGVRLIGQPIGHRPLLTLGITLTIMGIQLITTGFIAEIVMRTYYEAQGKKPYVIKRHIGG